jgi:hypothetical protein
MNIQVVTNLLFHITRTFIPTFTIISVTLRKHNSVRSLTTYDSKTYFNIIIWRRLSRMPSHFSQLDLFVNFFLSPLGLRTILNVSYINPCWCHHSRWLSMCSESSHCVIVTILLFFCYISSSIAFRTSFWQSLDRCPLFCAKGHIWHGCKAVYRLVVR